MLPGLTTFSIPEEKVLWISTGILEKPSVTLVLLLEVLVKISLPSINLSWGECSFSCMTDTVTSFPTSISNQIWRNTEVKQRWKRTWFSINSQVARCFSLVRSGREPKKWFTEHSDEKAKKALFSSKAQIYVSQLGAATGIIPLCFPVSDWFVYGRTVRCKRQIFVT